MIGNTTAEDNSLQHSRPGTLMDYQHTGMLFLLNHPQCLLLDESGLGKTVMVLAALDVLRNADLLGRVVLVVPTATLGGQWEEEATLWLPGVPVFQASVQNKNAIDDFHEAETALLVVTYSMLRTRLARLTSNPVSVAVLDEASELKGGGKEHAAARTLSRHADRAIGLTATPLENSGVDTWAILDAVGTPGLWTRQRHDAEFIQWRRGYTMSWGQIVPPKPVGLIADSLPELRAYLETHALRRTADEVGLTLPVRTGPELIIVPPTPEQAEHLRWASERLTARKRSKELEMASGQVKGRSAKAVRAVQWLMSNPQHSKVLIYAEHVDHLDVVANLLAAEGIGYLRIEGKIPAFERVSAVKQFAEDSTIRVLLGTEVMERGLNLQCASALLSLGSSWNPAREDQREGRIRRYGSPHGTYGHITFLLDHPYELEKWATLQDKREQAHQLHNGDSVQGGGNAS